MVGAVGRRRAHLPARSLRNPGAARRRYGTPTGRGVGLSPDDVDFPRGTITVRRQVKLTPGNQPYLAPPKGRKVHAVPMPDSVRAALSAHLEPFPARTVTLPWDGPDGALVSVALALTTRESRPVNRHYFNAKIWKPALNANSIPAIRENGCHALRHYYASVLLDGGESIKTVSERLGHFDAGFTLRTYTHLMPDSESRTRDIIDTAFRAFPTPRTKSPESIRTTLVDRARSTGPTRQRRAPGYFGPQR